MHPHPTTTTKPKPPKKILPGNYISHHGKRKISFKVACFDGKYVSSQEGNATNSSQQPSPPPLSQSKPDVPVIFLGTSDSKV